MGHISEAQGRRKRLGCIENQDYGTDFAVIYIENDSSCLLGMSEVESELKLS